MPHSFRRSADNVCNHSVDGKNAASNILINVHVGNVRFNLT